MEEIKVVTDFIVTLASLGIACFLIYMIWK